MKLTPRNILKVFNNFTTADWTKFKQALDNKDKDTIAKMFGTTNEEMDKDFLALHKAMVTGGF